MRFGVVFGIAEIKVGTAATVAAESSGFDVMVEFGDRGGVEGAFLVAVASFV